MNGAIRRTCGVVGWLLLAACAGGCVQAMPRGDETELLSLSGLLEPAPVRADLPRSDQLPAGPVCDGDSCLNSDAHTAYPIEVGGPPYGPFVNLRVLLSRLFLPLRCVGSGRCGRLGRCDEGRCDRLGRCDGGHSDGGPDPASLDGDYHHSQFHPIPTRPVFDPRIPPFLAMDARMGPHGSPEPVPVAPLPDRSTPTKATPLKGYPSSDTDSPLDRLEVLPASPATDSSDSGDRTVLSRPLDTPNRDITTPRSWVFHPPALRDPEPVPTTAQVRRSVQLDRKSGRVIR